MHRILSSYRTTIKFINRQVVELVIDTRNGDVIRKILHVCIDTIGFQLAVIIACARNSASNHNHHCPTLMSTSYVTRLDFINSWLLFILRLCARSCMTKIFTTLYWSKSNPPIAKHRFRISLRADPRTESCCYKPIHYKRLISYSFFSFSRTRNILVTLQASMTVTKETITGSQALHAFSRTRLAVNRRNTRLSSSKYR